MSKYNYEVITIQCNENKLQTILNEYGDRGFQLKYINQVGGQTYLQGEMTDPIYRIIMEFQVPERLDLQDIFGDLSQMMESNPHPMWSDDIEADEELSDEEQI